MLPRASYVAAPGATLLLSLAPRAVRSRWGPAGPGSSFRMSPSTRLHPRSCIYSAAMARAHCALLAPVALLLLALLPLVAVAENDITGPKCMWQRLNTDFKCMVSPGEGAMRTWHRRRVHARQRARVPSMLGTLGPVSVLHAALIGGSLHARCVLVHVCPTQLPYTDRCCSYEHITNLASSPLRSLHGGQARHGDPQRLCKADRPGRSRRDLL